MASLRLVVMALVSFAGVAVRVEDERDAYDERSERERRKLFRRLSQTRLGRGKGQRQQLGEADQNKGSGAQQEDDRDLEVRELVSERQDEDRADEGGKSGQQIPEQSLEAIRADGEQRNKWAWFRYNALCTTQHKGRKNRSHRATSGGALRRDLLWRITRAKVGVMTKKGGPSKCAPLSEWARAGAGMNMYIT